MTKKEELLDFINSVDTKQFDGLTIKYQCVSDGGRKLEIHELSAIGKTKLTRDLNRFDDELKSGPIEIVGYYECKFNW